MTPFVQDCRSIRERSPLILNITNYVAMNFTANALLAIGASPLMSSESGEMDELVELCSALVINIGCLEKAQIEAMQTAAAAAERLGRPWVLDPAGAGASRLRTQTALELAARRPAVIRGNAAEILCLAGASVASRGVDSAVAGEMAVEAGRELAQRYGTVVSISGPRDYITDGAEVVCVGNGSPLMPRVTAMGCAASAVTGAFAAVEADKLQAAAGAMALMGVAGGLAASAAAGTGSLATGFIDILSTLQPEEAEKLIVR